MTLEEAKSRFKDEIEGQGFYNDNEHREMAIAAFEKQTQMKPTGDSLFKGNCPVCGKFVSIGDDYCSKCGQALRWEIKRLTTTERDDK